MILNMAGGGAGLNFIVVGGTSQPTAPAENTIWVNTSTAISDWVFSETQPSGLTGRVWFKTDTSSAFGFNALKKNGIWVYPTGCVQDTGDVWAIKTAKIYRNGAWAEWNSMVFDGGTYGLANSFVARSNGGNGATATPGSYIQLDIPAWINGAVLGVAYTTNSINLTPYSRAKFDIQVSSLTDARCGVLHSIDTYTWQFTAYTAVPTTGRTTVTVDISSATGNLRPCLQLRNRVNAADWGRIHSIYLY